MHTEQTETSGQQPTLSRRSMLGRGGLVVALAAAGTTAAACGSSSSNKNALGTLRPGMLSVATLADSKPNAWIDNNIFKGFDLDLIRAIGKGVDLEVQFSAIDFPGLLPAIAQGRYDVGAASIAGTVARQKIVAFSRGYLGGYLGVLTTKTSGITKDTKSTNNKRLGLVQGTIQEQYAEKFLPGATRVTFPDNNAGVAALRSGRVDAFFLDFVVGTDYEKQYSNLTQPIAVPAFDQPAAFPVKKGSDALLAALNDGLGAVVKDGTWQKLYDQYFSEAPKPKSLPPYALPTSS